MFFDRLEKRCDEMGFKVTPLLEELDISRGSIGRWKSGTLPNGETLLKLASRLNCSVDYLLGCTDQEEKPVHGNRGGVDRAELRLARRIDLLKQRNISYKKLSQETGISEYRLKRYFTEATLGNTDYCEEFPKLAKALGVSPQYLHCLTDQENDKNDTVEKFINYIMGHSNIQDFFPEFQHLYEQKEPTPVAEDGLDPELVALIKRIPADRMPEVERYLRFQAESEEKL